MRRSALQHFVNEHLLQFCVLEGPLVFERKPKSSPISFRCVDSRMCLYISSALIYKIWEIFDSQKYQGRGKIRKLGVLPTDY